MRLELLPFTQSANGGRYVRYLISFLLLGLVHWLAEETPATNTDISSTNAATPATNAATLSRRNAKRARTGATIAKKHGKKEARIGHSGAHGLLHIPIEIFMEGSVSRVVRFLTDI